MIDNQPIATDQYHEIFSPHDRTKVGKVPCCGETEVEEAVSRAHDAFQTTARQHTPFEHYSILNRLAALMEAEQESLATLITQESGKIIRDSRIEVARAIITTRFAAEQARNVEGTILSCDVTPKKTGMHSLAFRIPLGVVAAITPFNFPINSVMHKVAPALATGNTVVLKPALKAPLSAQRLGELYVEAGGPPGLLNMVYGDAEVGEALVQHPLVKVVTFTGSVEIGYRIAQLAGMKQQIYELGGNDPLIVFPDGDIGTAVEVAIEQGFGSCGQRCTAVKRIFLHKDIAETFTAKLLQRAKQLKKGDPLDDKTDYGPMINEAAAIDMEKRVNEAVQAGAKLLLGGQRKEAVYPPTILSDIPPETRLVQTETFGPILPIMTFSSVEALIEAVNSTDYGLQAGLFTQRLDIIKRLFAELEVGGLNINQGPGFRIDTLPFGGTKSSGLGREGIANSMREMTEEKALNL